MCLGSKAGADGKFEQPQDLMEAIGEFLRCETKSTMLLDGNSGSGETTDPDAVVG